MMESILLHLSSVMGHSIFLSALFCFLGGVLASLTPCTYPLIPIVVTYIGSKSLEKRGRFTSFFLSFSYITGMASVYSVLGIIAVFTGTIFGKISTNPWSYFFVANVFILLGLNVLDVIPIPVISPKNSEKKGILGAYLVGCASGLITSPCTTPVLGAILFFVGSTKSVLWAVVLMFSFSMGMGLLLLLAGTFSGLLTSLPRPGNWMKVVKKFIGLFG